MSKEAIKLALEALETLMLERGSIYDKAITALREALAEQPAQQEPVAWRVKVETKLRDGSVDFGYQLRNERLSKYDEPLYTFPPAQRTWVGLTAEEIDTIYREIPPPVEHWKLSRAIEAKLKEKNNGN